MTFTVSSRLEIPLDEADQLLTMGGVNAELRPLVRMTAPVEWADRPISDWPAGRVLFSSWILLFGFIPIDRHRFLFRRIDPGRGFVEQSSSLTHRVWQHQRSIERDGAFCRVTDTVDFRCRLPLLSYLLAPVYRFIFRHRHAVLRARFGGRAL